jgi:hypothetical protein
MSRVSELIDLIVQGKNAEASEVLNNELLSRSYQGINDLKPEVAAQYFSPVVGEVEQQEQPEVETDETDS